MVERNELDNRMSEQALRFLMTLRPGSGFHYTLLDNSIKSRKAFAGYISYQEIKDFGASFRSLLRGNHRFGQDVIICINTCGPEDSLKGRSPRNSDITEILAQWLDFDAALPSDMPLEEKGRLLEDYKKRVLEALMNAPLKPTVVVDSRNGIHAYFKVIPGENQSISGMVDHFAHVQRALSVYFKEFHADNSIKDARRHMRIPGFYNHKEPKIPYPITLNECHEDVAYTQQQLLEAFGGSAVLERSEKRVKTSLTSMRIPKMADDNADQRLVSTLEATPDEISILIQNCETLRDIVNNPADMGYERWRAVGSNLCRCGTAGRELFHDLSRRDTAHYDASDFPDIYEDIVHYHYGCRALKCPKFHEYEMIKTSNVRNTPPCGVGVPFDLILKHRARQQYKSPYRFERKPHDINRQGKDFFTGINRTNYRQQSTWHSSFYRTLRSGEIDVCRHGSR